MQLGATIASLRKERGLKQSDLAESVGLTVSYLSQVENDHREPSTSALRSIAEALEVPLPVLFFLAMDEQDVSAEKRDAFAALGRSFQERFRELL